MLTSLIIVVVWVAIATVGDMWCKTASGFANWRFAGAVACYMLCAVFAVVTFGRQQWGWVLLVWNGLNLAVGLWMSVALFHEPFTLRRAIASVLISAAILVAE